MNEKMRIGWIGTGVMGRWMCRHLLEAGYPVTVYNRTMEKASDLIERGAEQASSPREAASQADVVFTIVGNPADVEDVYFSKQGILAGARVGAYLVDMTTTKPSLAVTIYREAKNLGISSVDAPVSGGDVGAKEAKLTIMAGGDKEAYDAVLPLLSLMGKQISYMGKAGAGQHTKMCNQITIAGTMIGVCEALLYSYKAGIPVDRMVQTISTGAAGCWSLDNLAPRIMRYDFRPGFSVDHFIKDMGIALEEAKRMNLSLPGLSLVHQLYIALRSHGHGKSGTQALIIALDSLSSTDVFSEEPPGTP